MSSAEQTLSLELTGEMLFSGANTLSMQANTSAISLAEGLNIEAEKLVSVGVLEAIIELDAEQKQITESLLLQIVSDQEEMTTIGTLSPLPEGNAFSLNLANEMDLLPYLKDEGTTWVLDLNLSEDYMGEMIVPAELNLVINYQE